MIRQKCYKCGGNLQRPKYGVAFCWDCGAAHFSAEVRRLRLAHGLPVPEGARLDPPPAWVQRKRGLR